MIFFSLLYLDAVNIWNVSRLLCKFFCWLDFLLYSLTSTIHALWNSEQPLWNYISYYSKHFAAERWDLDFGWNTTEFFSRGVGKQFRGVWQAVSEVFSKKILINVKFKNSLGFASCLAEKRRSSVWGKRGVWVNKSYFF